MAYGAKYIFRFSDIYQNTTGQYIATIYKKDYTDVVYELTCSGSPLVIETDRTGGESYKPLIASKATFNILLQDGNLRFWEDIPTNWNDYDGLWNSGSFDFSEFLTADPDTFYLQIQKKMPGDVYATIWKGYYIYTSDLSIAEIQPISLSLQFSDVLLMRVNRFFNFPDTDNSPTVQYFPSDRISVLDIIMRCGYFSGITNNVSVEFPLPAPNTYKNALNQTINSLANLVQKNAFLVEQGKYDTIFNVLQGICNQFGLMAYFRNDTLYIRSYQNLINNTTRYTTLYNITGFNVTTDSVTYTLVDNVTVNDSLPTLNSGVFKNIGRDQSIRFNYPSDEVAVSNKPSVNINTPNYNMSSVSEIRSNAGLRNAINNWYLFRGREAYYNPLSRETIIIDSRNIELPRINPFHPYATSKTETFGTEVVFATQFTPVRLFDQFEFIDSEPFSVNPGDAFAFSYSAYTDGRLKNYPTSGSTSQNNVRPRPVVSIILQATDADNNEITYYYDVATNKFSTTTNFTTTGVLPLITIPNHVNDADLIYYNIKGVLDIPAGAKLRVRQYNPFYLGDFVTNPANDRCLYVQQCNLQVYSGSSISILPNNHKIRSYYKNVLNSDKDLNLESNIFIQDATRYVPLDPLMDTTESKTKNPILFASCYGNHVTDAFFTPASGANLQYFNPTCVDMVYDLDFISTIQENIIQNTGLINVNIEGTYKSDAVYFIGDKFSYNVTGFGDRTFVLLDYAIDLKQAAYNAILYSSEFSSTEGKLLNTQTIIN
jgi:hypothetical protein